MVKNKKKILFVDHDNGISGATISMGYLIKQFINNDYKVIVLTSKSQPGVNYLEQFGAETIYYSDSPSRSIIMTFHFTNKTNFFSIQWFKNLVKDLLSFINGVILAAKVLGKYKPEMVYLNEYVTIQFGLVAKLKSIPVVVHIRSLFIDQKFNLRIMLLRKILRIIPDFNFAITEIEANQIKGLSNKAGNVIIVPEFLSEDDFKISSDLSQLKKKFDVSGNNKVVTFLGGISSIKGSIDFISSIEYLSENVSNTKFILAGKNRDYKTSSDIHKYYIKCIEYLKRPKIKSRIKVPGEVENINDLLSISDIVISCSTISHFSRPIIEAWAHKKAVIATDIKHTSNLIENEINGILVPANNPRELAATIERLLSDKKLCEEMGKNGYKKAKEMYSEGINTGKIVNYCTELLNK